jgi:SAM-dependent methyltransferase
VRNVLLQEGDIAALPFVDASFDLVVCRAALHHFEDPTRQVHEIARVCREGGRVVLSDMVAASPEVRDRFDEIHRWIDPSHDRALLLDEITALAASQVGAVRHGPVNQSIVLPLNAILTTQSDAERVNAALQAEIDGGPPTGFQPTQVDDGFQVEIASIVVHATRDRAIADNA